MIACEFRPQIHDCYGAIYVIGCNEWRIELYSLVNGGTGNNSNQGRQFLFEFLSFLLICARSIEC